MEGFHGWLKKKKQQGDEIPQSEDELHYMLKMERPRFLMKESPRDRYKKMSKKEKRYAGRPKHT